MLKNKLTHNILGALCEICLTLAIVVGLYIFYLVVWTGHISTNAQDLAVSKSDMTAPVDTKKPCPEYRNNYPVLLDVPEGQIIGQIYIPRFGSQYWRTLFQGTDKQMLDTMGFGHYSQTAMPGQTGNFSSAAHRNGYGSSLADIDKISKNDAIVVRTKDYWFVYKATTSEIVDPYKTDGILPVPYKPDTKPAERLLTFTTCHPQYSSQFRFIQHARIDYWSKVSQGVPTELLVAGVEIK
ncbi:MAG: class E sortase [Bifidobacteriaceae bacterium]|jgi:LPXTG-site transpeptidase (sortase) family protein|nr:class E sortase [Bifidobacteriaceae bacterium]